MVAWSLKCNIYLELDFHKLEFFFKINILCSTHNFYISRKPISYSKNWSFDISSIYIIILYFYDYKGQ